MALLLSPVTSYAYDNLYRLTTLTQADPDDEDSNPGPLASPETTYTYDAASQLTQITDPLARDTLRVYDDLGRVVRVTDELNQDTFYSYDAVGNLVQMTDDAGFSTLYSYDSLNYQVSTSDPRDGLTKFSHDPAGNLLALTDPAGNTTRWEYDRLDRAVRESVLIQTSLSSEPEIAARLFEYDPAGNLAEKTDRNGRVTEYAHDNLHRLAGEKWFDGETLVEWYTFFHDLAGQLTVARDTDYDHEYYYTYDNLGRLVTEELYYIDGPPPIVLDHDYDLLSRRIQLAATVDWTDDFLNTYQYDALGRMTQLTQTDNGGNAVAEKRVDFAYNALGQFTDVDRYQDTAGTDLIVASDYGYDALARLTSLTHENDAGTPQTLASYDWTYDSLNRVESFDNDYYWNSQTYSESVDYTYDATGQLIAADHDGTSDDEQYVYDLNGNRQLATNTLASAAAHETGANNRLLSDGAYEYEYDAEGNRVKRTHIASGDYTEYDWDHRNRLIRVTESDDQEAITQVVDHFYDVFDRWIRRRVDTTSPFDMADADETHFIYDSNQIILQFHGDQSADLTHRYLWGPAVDQILADEQYDTGDTSHDDPATETGLNLWPLTDHLNTVRDIAQHDATSGVALLVNHLQYNSFGLVTSETDTTIDLLFLFTARPYDEYTNLQNNHHRWYDAIVGTWVSEDPIGFDSNDVNLYRYVANEVISFSDPSGQQAKPVIPEAQPLAPELHLPSVVEGFDEILAGMQLNEWANPQQWPGIHSQEFWFEDGTRLAPDITLPSIGYFLDPNDNRYSAICPRVTISDQIFEHREFVAISTMSFLTGPELRRMLQSLATEKQKQDLIKAIQEKDTVKELEDFLSSEVKSRALGLLWESTKEIVGRLRGKEWRNIILDPCPPPNRPQKRFTLTLEINPELDEAAKTQLIDVLNGKETNLNAIRIPVTISVNAVIQW